MNIEKIGAVFTKTVAFSKDVFLTANTKRMKWLPRRNPKIRNSLEALQEKFILSVFLRMRSITAKAAHAMISRQKTIQKEFTSGNKRMNIAAVLNRNPARIPSDNATRLLFTIIYYAILISQEPLCLHQFPFRDESHSPLFLQKLRCE